ncbi:MAG: ABC transporter permease, partial [Acidobacteriota bacterium]
MRRQDLSESLKLAISTLLSHKFRSVLTVLGVIVGTTTVIAVSSILTGMNQRVSQLMEEFGTNTVYIARWSFGPRFGDLSPEERQRKPLSNQDAQAIRELPSVYAVAASLFPDDLPPVVKYSSQQIQNPQLRGVWSSYLESRGYLLALGRFFTEAEDEHRTHVCVIGHSIANTLFVNVQPLDKEIDIRGEKFRVIGVLEKTKTSLFGEERFEDNLVIIPYNMFRKFYPRQDEHVISARSKAGQFEAMTEQITELLRRRRKVAINKPDNFAINTSSSVTDQFKAITGAMALVVVPISGIGLLVGGIGVMNIMLVSVTERTREIGIRRAIGARRRDIIFQFLIEAMMLTGMGGVLGIIIGQLISTVINFALPDLPSSVPLWAVALGFSFSVMIGLLFGLWPALKAAYLDPVEALR